MKSTTCHVMNGEIEEVKNILNQRTIVKRDGDKLKATMECLGITYELPADADVYGTFTDAEAKKVDVGVYETIKECINGELKGGISNMYNISNDGVGYEDTKFITNEIRELINEKIN
mgnify:CR=1 FL=1